MNIRDSRRIHFLTKRLETVTVVDAADRDTDQVFFGAFVEVEDEDGKSASYRIVGVDETEPNDGRISYKSPLGRALLKKRVGDTVVFRKPSGDVELSILTVRYRAE